MSSPMEQLENAVGWINVNVLWAALLPIILVGSGIYFGIRTRLVQITAIKDMFRSVTENPGKEDAKDDGLSAFKSFTISAASRVGTGNVAGVAVAITTGGPGAVFWMWTLALLGGATAFVESTLAQLWKTRDGGSYHGGPAYYITRGLKAPWLAVIFAVAISITYGLVYNAIQTNSIVEAFGTSFGDQTMGLKIIVGVVLALLTAAIIFGGLKRIANVTQIVVPFMAGAYIIIGVLVLVLNVTEIPQMFADIVLGAFGVREFTGGVLGTIIVGMQRGLFSNEAGMGSAPNAAATSTVSHPAKQGFVQTLGVYFDTLVVCSITAFIIMLGNPSYGSEAEGVSLTQNGLAASVGDWGIHFVTFILFFLAFSSVLGNYYLAQANIEYFTEKKSILNIFRLAVVACVFGGALGSVTLVWQLGDTFAAIMVVINIIAIVPLGGVAIKLLANYRQQKKNGLDPVFHRDMLPQLRNVECWDGTDAATMEAKQRLDDVATWRRVS